MATSIYETGLDKCQANYAALSPLSFLPRSAQVYPDKVAVIDGVSTVTWSELYRRCRKMASALARSGISKGSTVSVLAPNSLAAYETHFSVPMAGAVLNTINTRLDAQTVAFILEHGESELLLVDSELLSLAEEAIALMQGQVKLIEIPVPGQPAVSSHTEYETFMETGSEEDDWELPEDEWDAISLNYTSGTTGNPKGVVYHHRGAYLNAMSNAVGWSMDHHPVYLWTLPMFHCNGWCFPWTLAAVGGVSVCLRQINAQQIFSAIAKHRVTHFCGAPIIMNMLINAQPDEKTAFDHEVKMMTAAAPPPASVLAAMQADGFNVTHVYGLTETYGPAVICAWHDEWDALSSEERAAKQSRQGVRYHALEALDIVEAGTADPVESNAEQLGEVVFRGNIVMKGYLKNPYATEKAFKNGWFNSGDLGVMHADRYIQLKDRSKDIIISGGENISSIEVEDCLYGHADVIEVAVVAKPDDYWGETPCAFVGVVANSQVTEADLIEYCRENLAHYKCPKNIVFGELPKTSTGKVQKFKLRDQAKEL